MTGNRSAMQMVDTLVEHRRNCATPPHRLLFVIIDYQSINQT